MKYCEPSRSCYKVMSELKSEVELLSEVRIKDLTRICHKPSIGHDIHPRTIKPSHHSKFHK